MRDVAGLLRRNDVGDRRLHARARLRHDLHRLGIDARDLEIVDLVGQVEIDDAVVVFGERLLERGLLGERLLGVEDDELRFRLLGLQEVRDHARALVRPRRAAVGVARHRHDDGAAVLHRLELPHQEQRLLTRLPGVRHDFGRLRRIALDRLVLEVDAGREHEPVVGKRLSLASVDRLLAAIDVARGVGHDVDAELAQPVVGVLQRGERAEAAEVVVRIEAGGVDRLRLDDRHLKRGRLALQDARDRRAAGAAADDDDLGPALGEGWLRKEAPARARQAPRPR